VAEKPIQDYPAKRRSRRLKVARRVKVRPSDPNLEHFEDLPMTINASREGIYFSTRQNSYYPGMRLFVTYPYDMPHDPLNSEYMGEVMRVEKLQDGKLGVAVQLMLGMNVSK
jgi:hypothetical protein